VFLPEDYGSHQSEPGPPNLWVVIRRGDIELLEESDQERLHLDHTIQKTSLSVPGRVDDMKDEKRTRLAIRCSP